MCKQGLGLFVLRPFDRESEPPGRVKPGRHGDRGRVSTCVVYRREWGRRAHDAGRGGTGDSGPSRVRSSRRCRLPEELPIRVRRWASSASGGVTVGGVEVWPRRRRRTDFYARVPTLGRNHEWTNYVSCPETFRDESSASHRGSLTSTDRDPRLRTDSLSVALPRRWLSYWWSARYGALSSCPWKNKCVRLFHRTPLSTVTDTTSRSGAGSTGLGQT